MKNKTMQAGAKVGASLQFEISPLFRVFVVDGWQP
jgi:hypothetical protein